MANITPTTITEAGAQAEFAAVGASGDGVLATGRGTIVVEFRNESGESPGDKTITLSVPSTSISDPTYGTLTKANQTLVLSAGQNGCFSLKNPYGLADANGYVQFTYDDTTDLKIRAIKAT